MKFDNLYFRTKLAAIMSVYDETGELDTPENEEILKQIVRDAAEGQRINCSAACALRMKGKVDANCKCGEIYCAAKLEIPE